MKSINCPFCGSEINEGSSICRYCKEDLNETQKPEQKSINKKWLYAMTVVAILGLFILVIPFISSHSTKTKKDIPVTNDNLKGASENGSTNQVTIENVETAVVNIICPDINSKFLPNPDSGSGGSGSLATEDGFIITNAHIFPKKNGVLDIHPEGCFVILPEAGTGKPKEIYLAKPLYIKDLSEKYDLAFLNIYGVYTDSVGIEYGSYPKKFNSTFKIDPCLNSKIGDKITILGYPALTGGYSLTITDGLISALKDGIPMTNAKISSGNSGGLAFGPNNCILGVPSSVVVGEYENYGVIIPMSMVLDFISEIQKQGEKMEVVGSTVCGANSFSSADGKCSCEKGYKWASSDPNSLDCVVLDQCPENSSLNDDGLCYCNQGYAKNLTKNNCLKIPANAHAVDSSTDAWLCDQGFVEIDNECKQSCGLGSYLAEGKTCKCLAGYVWENGNDLSNFDCIKGGQSGYVSYYPGYPISFDTKNYSYFVQKIQTRLNTLGYSLVADGYFGTKTKAAVIEFQRAYNITPTGTVDKQTWDTLFQ